MRKAAEEYIWHFLHSFFSYIPPSAFGFSKFKIFFEKLALFCVVDLELFCDQCSSIVPAFKYLRVTTAQWNFLHRFLSVIPCNAFGLILKFRIFFEKLALFRVSDLELFCDQYSSIVPAFKYLRVTTAHSDCWF